MNTYAPRKGEYRPVGNLTMDTITAAINHYGRFGKKVKRIRLNNSMWKGFLEYMKQIDPAYKLYDEFELDSTTIAKGSILQIKKMDFEFYESNAEA